MLCNLKPECQTNCRSSKLGVFFGSFYNKGFRGVLIFLGENIEHTDLIFPQIKVRPTLSQLATIRGYWEKQGCLPPWNHTETEFPQSPSKPSTVLTGNGEIRRLLGNVKTKSLNRNSTSKFEGPSGKVITCYSESCPRESSSPHCEPYISH